MAADGLVDQGLKTKRREKSEYQEKEARRGQCNAGGEEGKLLARDNGGREENWPSSPRGGVRAICLGPG